MIFNMAQYAFHYCVRTWDSFDLCSPEFSQTDIREIVMEAGRMYWMYSCDLKNLIYDGRFKTKCSVMINSKGFEDVVLHMFCNSALQCFQGRQLCTHLRSHHYVLEM